MISRSRVLGALMLAVTVGCSGAPASSPSPGASPTSPPTSAPTDSPTPSPSPTPSLPPTPSPTPAPETLTFDDGALTIEVPFGAIPEGVELQATQRGPEDAPPELAELEFRGSFYSLEPDGLTFSQPLRVTRRVVLADTGVNVEGVGVPIINLALRTSDGTWSWLPNQSQISDGEFLYVSGDLTHTSTLIGFGGNHFARHDYTPPEVGGLNGEVPRIPVGSTWDLRVIVNGPITTDEPPQLSADWNWAVSPVASDIQSLRNSVWYYQEPFTHTGVIAQEPVIDNSPNWSSIEPLDRRFAMPRLDQQFGCAQAGRFYTIVGYEVVQAPGNVFYQHLGLPPPATTLTYDAGFECFEGSAQLPELTGACVAVVHDPFEAYASYLRMLFGFEGPIDAIEVTVEGAHDGQPATGERIDTNVWEVILGLHAPGPKRLELARVTSPDGDEHDVTQAFADSLARGAWEVPYPGEPTFGTCP